AFRDGVDDHERRVGELAGDGRDGVSLEEPWGNDQLGPLEGDAALTFGRSVGRPFELDDLDLETLSFELGCGLFHAAPRALVEGAVELTAGVVHEAEHEVLGGGCSDEQGSDQDEQFAHEVGPLVTVREVSYLRDSTIPTAPRARWGSAERSLTMSDHGRESHPSAQGLPHLRTRC